MQEKEIINTVVKFTEKISNGENFSKYEAIFVLDLIKKTNCNLNVYKGMIVIHYFLKFKEFPDSNLEKLIKDEKFLKLVALLNGEPLPPSEVGKIFLEILKISDLESDYRDILIGCFYNATWSFMNNPENYEKAVDYGTEIIKSAFSLDDFDVYKKNKHRKNGMRIINLAGSGKKEIKLLNISSLTAIITAAVGKEIGENIVVEKTVSKATSSVTGSRDIFELLGVNLDLPINKMFEISLKTSFGIFDINRIVPRLNHVYDGRLYNVQVFAGLVGGAAIVNPVDADLIIYGLTRGSIKVCLAILKKLYPDKNIIVLQGNSIQNKPVIDEISIEGHTTIAECINGNIIIRKISPREFGFDFKPFINIQSKQDPQENLKDFVKILTGQGNEELKQVVAMEVALNLYGLGVIKDLKTAARLALEIINEGKGIDILKNLIIYTQGNIDQFYKILETINLPKKLIEQNKNMKEKLHLIKEEDFYSKVWLGTWRMGGDITPDPNNDDERDIEVIRYAIKKGITQIDTSESYAGGKTETLIGEAIKIFPRDKICIATKVHEYNLTYNKILKSCEDSLKRLKTSYIDVYYIHKQNPHASISEITKALNKLLDIGYIKNIGLSNVGIETIEKYSKFLNAPIYAVQNQYNLVCRESQIKGVIDYCRRHNIRFLAWRPIMLLYPGSPDPFYPRGTYKLLDEIAEKYNKTNIQIAVKWLLQQNGISIVFKSSNKDHIDEILETKDFELAIEDWEKLDKEFPVQIDKGCTADSYFELS